MPTLIIKRIEIDELLYACSACFNEILSDSSYCHECGIDVSDHCYSFDDLEPKEKR